MVDRKDEYFRNFKIIKDISRNSSKTKIWIIEFNYYQKDIGFPKTAIMKQYNEKSNSRIEKEACILEYIGKFHHNIVQIYHHMTIKGKFVIFMEICSKDSVAYQIFHHNGKKIWDQMKLIKNFITISEVLAFLHDWRINIAHRDIKPDNIFVCEDDEWKIGDFGAAKKLVWLNEPNTVGGTELYMSPFLIEKRQKEISKSPEIDPKKEDVYSLGKTFYEIATMKLYEMLPKKEPEALFKVRQEMSEYSPELINIILSMLAYDIKRRPTMIEVYERLKQCQNNCAQSILENIENYSSMQIDEEKISARSTEGNFSTQSKTESKQRQKNSESSENQYAMEIEEEKGVHEGDNVFSLTSSAQTTINTTRHEGLADFTVSSPISQENETIQIQSSHFTIEDWNDYFTGEIAINEQMVNSAESLDIENITLSSSYDMEAGVSQNFVFNHKVICNYCGYEMIWERFEAFVEACLCSGQDLTDISCITCSHRYPEELVQQWSTQNGNL